MGSRSSPVVLASTPCPIAWRWASACASTTATRSGQKGWTGWGACSIVYGKVSPACGLITMRGESVPGATLASFTPVQYTLDEIDAGGIENADLAYNVYSAAITLDAVLDDDDDVRD